MLDELKKDLQHYEQKLSLYKFLRVMSYILTPVFYIFFLAAVIWSLGLLTSGLFVVGVAVVVVLGFIIWHEQENREMLHRFIVEHLKYDINIILDEITTLEYVITEMEAGRPVESTRLMITAHPHSPKHDYSWMD